MKNYMRTLAGLILAFASLLAVLILALVSLQAAAQEAPSSLNGIWLSTEREGEGFAFLTIIHNDDGQLAVVSTNYVSFLGIVEGYQSGASLGQAELSELGDEIGSAMSVPTVFYGADVRFTLHRPAADELLVELTSCSVPEGNAVTCETIYDQGFPLNERVRYNKVF